MRKVLIGAILAAFALAPIGAQASQSVEGSVAAPTRFPDTETTSVSGGYPGLGRRLYTVSPETNGLVSYAFAIDESTIGGDFTLGDVADDTGVADLDIFFYYDLGDDVIGERAPVVAEDGEFTTVGAGGETGTVPADARFAIVFMTIGANATFTYSVA